MNRQGSAVLTSIILVGVSLVLLMGIGQAILQFNKLQSQQMGDITVDQVLNSALDYTMTAVKQNWCMTPTWTKSLTSCDLQDPYNIERLLLNEDNVKYLGLLGLDISKIRISKIGPVEVSLSSIQTGHPLFSMLDQVYKFGGKKILFSIERIQNIQTPNKGREIPIKITVEMVFSIFTKKTKIENIMYVFPREIGTQTLVLANNLYLNSSESGFLSEAGNSRIALDNELAKSGGLRFLSPVFVNGDVYLPDNKSNKISNVTFADKLILGGGYVKQDNDFFIPNTLGGDEDKYTSQLEKFGGFLGGVELDPERDLGLDVLSGSYTPPVVTSNFEVCKQRQLAKMDLTKTRDSQLWQRIVSETTSEVKSILNFGKIDSLLPQKMEGNDNSSDNDFKIINHENNSEPIVRVWISSVGYDSGVEFKTYASLSRSGKFTLKNSNFPNFSIEVQTSPYFINDNVQDHLLNLKVIYKGIEDLPLTGGNGSIKVANPRVVVQFEAFDLGYANGIPTREKDPGSISYATAKVSDTAHYFLDKFKMNGIEFVKKSGSFKINKGINFKYSDYYSCSLLGTEECNAAGFKYFEAESYPNNIVTTPFQASASESEDLAAVDLSCGDIDFTLKPLNNSFQVASWDTSFLSFTKKAWSFSGNGSWQTSEVAKGEIDVADLTGKRTDPVFNVIAYANNCNILAEADFVTGFFVCNKLLIKPRTKPLRIIGTFIVNKMSIDPSAIRNGIVWSSIYEVNSVSELRDSQILPGKNCDNPNKPVWMPYPSVDDSRNQFFCNSISLRAKADPFRWTTIDPDCGVASGSSMVSCKGRVKRWIIKELYRRLL